MIVTPSVTMVQVVIVVISIEVVEVMTGIVKVEKEIPFPGLVTV